MDRPSLWFRLQRAIAKERIKMLEYQAFIEAGKENSPYLIKAQKIRRKYHLEYWRYEIDY